MANDITKTWLSTKEAAALAGRDHSTIRRWVTNGALRVMRVGKVNLVSRRSVEKMISKRDGRWNRTAEAN
jgi:excisionase family DNA binding protein